MRFDNLKLSDAVLRAVHAEGYEIPTPIQEKAIPHVLLGKDLLGCAQTGTGKTAAFALPILSRLGPQGTTDAGAPEPLTARTDAIRAGHPPSPTSPSRAPSTSRYARVLVLTPTRELAVQIAESFTTYGKFTGLRVGLIFGGVSQGSQERMLRAGVDIIVATPGRLMDLMNQRLVHLTNIEVFVLDEADRMLDMGFIADIRKIIARLPTQRQTLLFSATMPPEIKRLADGILRHPVHVAVSPISSTAERVEQSVYHVERRAKPSLLLHLLDNDRKIQRVLIFTRTKHGADRLAKGLAKHSVMAEAIHGNKSQNQRQRALDTFKQGQSRVLVATDIAARGLDIELVSHVINYELPNIPESYVHRIGRTARAGESGVAISFCDPEEREFLRDIERLIRNPIPVATNPLAIGGKEAVFGQERDSDRRALRGNDGGRGGRGNRGDRGGFGGRGRPDPMNSRSSPDPAPRPTTSHRPASGNSPRPLQRPAVQWRPDGGRPASDPRPMSAARPMAHRPSNRPGEHHASRAGGPTPSTQRFGFNPPPRGPSPLPASQSSHGSSGRPVPSGQVRRPGGWSSGESRNDGPRAEIRRETGGARPMQSFSGSRDRNRSGGGGPNRRGPNARSSQEERRPESRGNHRPEHSRSPSGRPDPRH